MTAPDNERPSTGDVRVSDETKRLKTLRHSADVFMEDKPIPRERQFVSAVKYDALEAENTRLRRALSECVGAFETLEVHGQMCHDARTAEFMARAALAADTKDAPPHNVEGCRICTPKHEPADSQGSPRACEASTMQPKETE